MCCYLCLYLTLLKWCQIRTINYLLYLLEIWYKTATFHKDKSCLPHNFIAYFIFAGLPGSKLGNYLETRINTFLKKKDAGAGEVFIKVLSSSDKMVEVRPGMKTR